MLTGSTYQTAQGIRQYADGHTGSGPGIPWLLVNVNITPEEMCDALSELELLGLIRIETGLPMVSPPQPKPLRNIVGVSVNQFLYDALDQMLDA